LPVATHLRLARNRLTDASAATVAALPALVHLNVYGNENITDAALAALAGSSSLREVYLWRTGVTASGAARLREQRPELVVHLGATLEP
jgi:hypothetical protein